MSRLGNYYKLFFSYQNAIFIIINTTQEVHVHALEGKLAIVEYGKCKN